MMKCNGIQQKKTERGFSLLELIIIVAIIGLIIAIFVSYLGEAREKSRDTARYKQALEVLNALELYYIETGEYPYVVGFGPNPTRLSNIGSHIQAYMSRIPEDPIYDASNGYHYCSSDDKRSMALFINTERDSGGSNYCVISRGPKAYIEDNGAGTSYGVCNYGVLENTLTMDDAERCISRIKN